MFAHKINPYNMPRTRAFGPYAMPFVNNVLGAHTPLTHLAPITKQKVEMIWPWEQQGEPMPDYLCMILHGRRGRGKSTGATALAKYLYDTNRRLDPEYKVFSNYRVNFADMAHPRLVDALITFPPWLRKCLILIDEIAVYFPSLRATSTNALNFATFLQEIRKLEVDMIFTTQFPTMIIGNASIQVDLFIEPKLYHWGPDPITGHIVADSVKLDCVDWWGQWSGYPVPHRWPPNDEDIIASPSIHHLRSSGLYQEFNTKEIIPAFWHPSRQDVLQREWESEFAAEREAEAAKIEAMTPTLAPANHQAASLTALMQIQNEPRILLSTIINDAKRIDPQIKSFVHLATALRNLGWSCYQEGGKYGQWMGEKLS